MNKLMDKLVSDFKKVAKDSSRKYFLVHVDKVTIDKGNSDNFLVRGRFVDNNEPVIVYSKKLNAKQFMPVAGDVMRAEKTTPTKVQGRPELTAFTAEYYHAFADGEMCFQALTQAGKPFKNDRGWNARVSLFDPDMKGAKAVPVTSADAVKSALVDLLMPWAWKEPTAITHDVAGKPLWSQDPNNPMMGAQPVVTIQAGGANVTVYGVSFVTEGKGDQATRRLPRRDEVLRHIEQKGTTQFKSFMSALEGVIAESSQQELAETKVVLVPSVALGVGRDSLNGEREDYLRVPEAFEYSKQKADGTAYTARGIRNADVTVKTNSNDWLMAVSVAPNRKGRLLERLPVVNPDDLAGKQATAGVVQTNQSASRPSQPSKAAQKSAQPQRAPVAARSEPAPAPAPQQGFAHNDFDDGFDDAFSGDDFDAYANDMAAMADDASQQFSDTFADDDDLDLMMTEAASRQAKKSTPRQSM